MPEKERVQDTLLGLYQDLVKPSAAGKIKVFLDIGVGGVKFLGPAVVEDCGAEVAFEQVGVCEIVIQAGVLYLTLVDNFFIAKNRFFVKPLGVGRIGEGRVGFFEGLVCLGKERV